MSRVDYPYAQGDRLVERNTYFYTPIVGELMIAAWRRSREDVLAELPEAIDPPTVRTAVGRLPDWVAAKIDTSDLLEALWANLSAETDLGASDAWIARLVHKFETTKRLHSTYTTGFKAVDPAQHGDLELYLRTAEIFAESFVRSRKLPQLNALLKLVDTLCALRSRLSLEQRRRLAGLIRQECECVSSV